MTQQQQRTADAAVGMMDAAYFLGRKELLDFFNTLLALKLSKIEQTASGAIACQITDLIFPGSIPLSRIDWNAKSDYEYVQNYKLLQNAFNKHNVQRHVDVDKLIRAKYQDNLEFCQWLKAFFDQSGAYVRENYDPIAVRAKGKGGKQYNTIMGSSPSGTSSMAKARQPTTTTSGVRTTTNNATNSSRPTTTTSGTNNKPIITTTRTSTANSTKATASPTNPIRAATATASSRPLRERTAAVAVSNTTTSSSKTAGNSSAPSAATVLADAALIQKNSDLTNKLEQLEIAVIEIEKERDFYFEKLRNVEVLLQIYQERSSSSSSSPVDASVIENIFKILYATAEENVIVDDHGNAVPAPLFDTSRDMTNGTMTSFTSQQPQQLLDPPQEEGDEDDNDDDDDLFVDIPQQPEDDGATNNNNLSKSHVTEFLQNDEEEEEDDNELLVQDE